MATTDSNNTPNLETLSESILRHNGKLGVQNLPEVNRRGRFLAKMATNDKPLAAHRTELAIQLINTATKMDNHHTYGGVMVAIGFAKNLLSQEAQDPTVSNEALQAKSKQILDAIAENSATLAPNSRTYTAINPLFESMVKEHNTLTTQPDQGRKNMQAHLPQTKYSSSIKHA